MIVIYAELGQKLNIAPNWQHAKRAEQIQNNNKNKNVYREERTSRKCTPLDRPKLIQLSLLGTYAFLFPFLFPHPFEGFEHLFFSTFVAL